LGQIRKLERLLAAQEESHWEKRYHQGKVHIGGATKHTLWVPLGDCPRDKGPLAVDATSHRAGVLETKVGSGAGGIGICVDTVGYRGLQGRRRVDSFGRHGAPGITEPEQPGDC